MVNSLAENGNKLLCRGDLEILNNEASTILAYFENEINKKIPGVDAKRLFNIFQKDKKLNSLDDYFRYNTRKDRSISLVVLCNKYIDYIWYLYLSKPKDFFRLEDYLEKYLTERLTYFDYKVINQYRKTTKTLGICTVDIYLPDQGFIIELKSSVNRRDSLSVMLQVDKYQKTFGIPCLLLYSDAIHKFEKLFFDQKVPVNALLAEF